MRFSVVRIPESKFVKNYECNFRYAFGSVYIGVIATKIGHMKQGSVSRVSKYAFYLAESFDKIGEFCKTTEINL